MTHEHTADHCTLISRPTEHEVIFWEVITTRHWCCRQQAVVTSPDPIYRQFSTTIGAVLKRQFERKVW